MVRGKHPAWIPFLPAAAVMFAVGCLDWGVDPGDVRVDAAGDGDLDGDTDVDADTDLDVDSDGDGDGDVDADTDVDVDSDVDADTDADVDIEADVDLDIDVDASGLTCAETIECARDYCEGGTSSCFTACAEYTCLESNGPALEVTFCMLDVCMMQCLMDLGCWVCLQNHCSEAYEACLAAGC